VRVFGTDSHGRIFSETVTLVNLSQHGARLNGVKAQLKVDELVGITYGKNKVHFRVKWAGGLGTPAQGQVGLLNLHPERPFWNTSLPSRNVDTFKSTAGNERRKAVRVKCSVSVELHPAGQAALWGHASDLSQGGCFVEMAIPLQTGSKFEILLWLGANKLRLQGVAATSSPGFGMGVRFCNATPEDHEFLQEHILALV